MSSASGVDKDDVKAVLLGIADSVLGDVGGVFTVALFVELDDAALADGEFLEVTGVDAELLDCAGAECVTGSDEDFEFILEEEEADL